MKQYEYFPHTADMRFRAYGKTLEDAFKNASLAMFNIMLETKEVEPTLKRKISVQAKDKESLLFDFLGKFLFLLDSENFALNKVESITIKKKEDTYFLESVILGDELSEKYETKTQVKAITYNEMQIKHENGIWTINAVVDV
ncbi:MAG: archease [Candidatus Aenigmarchaeota archaeon]|nr:archease [Candidatus Aenigmarchaeota archaeon]MCK5334245.1 archease [Candidatus Aenigmarchaeota archaeon]